MEINEYQRMAQLTSIYNNEIEKRHKCSYKDGDERKKIENLLYPILGLSGEVGELNGKIKKYIRGDKNIDELTAEVKGELGDILWYLADISKKFGYSLNEIAKNNILKLFSRMTRDKIKGDGDER